VSWTALSRVTGFIKTKPRLHDAMARVYRPLFTNDGAFKFFNSFSRERRGRVTFVQIGASDGLQWDPIRYFVVRDRWDGIFVEPLPWVFDLLKKNYRHVTGSKLEFVNAAIASEPAGTLSFWTFDSDFLSRLSFEDRLIYTQKSSFYKDQVLEWATKNQLPDTVLHEVQVPCLTVNDLVTKYWGAKPIDLMVVDAEGHDASIIRSIDFGVFKPKAIYFEAFKLGADRQTLYDHLRQSEYELTDLTSGDCIALHTESGT
jgi:FkbM family methyltransferase